MAVASAISSRSEIERRGTSAEVDAEIRAGVGSGTIESSTKSRHDERAETAGLFLSAEPPVYDHFLVPRAFDKKSVEWKVDLLPTCTNVRPLSRAKDVRPQVGRMESGTTFCMRKCKTTFWCEGRST